MIEPKLRFKADDGSQFPDWKKKKLEDVVEFLDGQRKPLEAGQRVSGKYPYYGASGIIDYVEDYIFDEELILLSEDGANILDRNYRVCFLAKGKYWVNNHAHVLRAMDGNVNGFICEQLETFDYRKYNSGGAQPKLNQATCRAIIMNMPSLPEQQKIAEFLSTIDTVIKKQKETVSAWEERKKGVMQKLFSQEVRFKADDGSEFPEWEEKSYLSICNVFADGDWIESKDQSDSGIRLIQTGNIGNGVFIDKDDKKKYISKETFDRLKCNEVFEGDILISRLPSPAGRACIVPKLNERMITAVDCTIVRTDKSIILHDYCVQFMQSSKHFYYVASMMAGGTRQRISRKNLEDELISVPCLEEQQKIADCLSSLDEVIENQKATLAAWEELKKGLLQQMFV